MAWRGGLALQPAVQSPRGRLLGLCRDFPTEMPVVTVAQSAYHPSSQWVARENRGQEDDGG